MSRCWVMAVALLVLSSEGTLATAHDGHDRDAPGSFDRGGERTWTHASGRFQVEGSFVAVRNGQVRVRKSDGEPLDIKMEALSREDRQWVQNRKDALLRLNT